MLAKNIFLFLIVLPIFFSCKVKRKVSFVKTITEAGAQDTLFQKLRLLSKDGIKRTVISDSLTFLVLPVEAACPNCRKKTIDSIIKYKDQLDDKHFIIITGTGSRIIESFFRERKSELPLNSYNVIIDSINQAFIDDIIFTRPEIYQAYNQKVYQQISCVPVNIKKELGDFFGTLSKN